MSRDSSCAGVKSPQRFGYYNNQAGSRQFTELGASGADRKVPGLHLQEDISGVKIL